MESACSEQRQLPPPLDLQKGSLGTLPTLLSLSPPCSFRRGRGDATSPKRPHRRPPHPTPRLASQESHCDKPVSDKRLGERLDQIERSMRLQTNTFESVERLSGIVAQLNQQVCTIGRALCIGEFEGGAGEPSPPREGFSRDRSLSYTAKKKPTSAVPVRALEKTRAPKSVDLWALMMHQEASESSKDARVHSRCLPLCVTSMLTRLAHLGGAASTTIVLLNAVFIGIGEDLAMKALLENSDIPEWLFYGEVVFACLFVAELSIRMAHDGRLFFTDRNERMWNLFDVVMVAPSILSPLLTAFSLSSLSSARIFRVFRMFRAVRIFRIVRGLETLRLIVAMILCSMQNVFWAFVFLIMFSYMWAIIFMNLVTQKMAECQDQDGKVDSCIDSNWLLDVRQKYGSVLRSLCTLIASISGGVDWLDAAAPLEQIRGYYMFFYILFVMFVAFGLLNILTGIFVDSAKKVSLVDRDLVIRAQMVQRQSLANKLKRSFKGGDLKEVGLLSLQELEHCLASRETQGIFASMDVSPWDARSAFKLLDISGSGEVDINEFILCLMRFLGNAKSADMATLLYECKRNDARWSAYIEYIEEQFDAIGKRLHLDRKATGLGTIEVGKVLSDASVDLEGLF